MSRNGAPRESIISFIWGWGDLDDVVEEMLADEAKVTVDCCGGTALEIPCSFAVMGECWISVLDECDHDEPVMNPEIREDIVS